MGEGPNIMVGWSSLEIAKLFVPIVSSLILAFVGLRISQKIEEFRSDADRKYKLVDGMVQKRIALYDKIGNKLNELFTYYMYVGKWKELSPDDIVRDKRDLDEMIFTYQPFFSEEFVRLYYNLQAELFQSYNGWGIDAMLRSEALGRSKYYLPHEKVSVWNPEWDARFTGEDNTKAIREAYRKLISQLQSELGIPPLSDQQVRHIDIEEIAKPNLSSQNLIDTREDSAVYHELTMLRKRRLIPAWQWARLRQRRV